MQNSNSSDYSMSIIKNGVVAFILIYIVLTGSALPAYADTLLINNVTVIDATGSPPQPGMSVLVVDGVIESIQPVKEVIKHLDCTVIEASGMYLIPGLWDMHAHSHFEYFLPLYIANGVTGVREMAGRDVHYEWRKRIGEKNFISPRFYIGSDLIDGDPPTWPGSTGVKDAEQARKEVNKYFQLGADFIKVYSRLSRAAYFAIADECKKLGMPFAGHVPNRVSLEEASVAGQKSMEHLIGFEQIKVDDDEAKVLYQLLKDNATWQCPTLTTYRNLADMKQRKLLDRDRMVFFPKKLTDSWDPDNINGTKNFPVKLQDSIAKKYEHDKKLVADMNKSGIRFLAGTDTGSMYCFSGFSLHDELELLVESGLSPMQALQASTRNAAEFMGKLDKMGTVEEGKIADLVLPNANPLDNIRNSQNIEAVIFGGRLNTRADLDEILSNAKREASSSNAKD